MSTPTSKPRILVVDDEVSFTHLVKLCLEDTGHYAVRTENRGAEALAAARAFRPDLILLDVIMPDLDGTEIAAQLQQDPSLQHVPIIFLTAIVSRREAGGATSSIIGGHRFIAKPESMNVIVACIEEALAHAVR